MQITCIAFLYIKSTKIMLNKIYEKIANKTLTMWCKIEFTYEVETLNEYWEDYAMATNTEIVLPNWYTSGEIELHTNDIKDWYDKDLDLWIKIIGHPVMIGDVLRYFNTKEVDGWLYSQYYSPDNSPCLTEMWELFDLRQRKDKPIDNQTQECKTYLHKLLLKEEAE